MSTFEGTVTPDVIPLQTIQLAPLASSGVAGFAKVLALSSNGDIALGTINLMSGAVTWISIDRPA
jgi:hypothetical protein